ncbi:hypothetical protein HGRIS_012293 [Hohenbuehelia grisea]|uniref:Carboxylesterase type B domain-containing protein n=1 Tax=Hohenbuehelia grisea TaxID=104357 RepID=A0ABR3IRZ1_9AGAR
MYPLSTYPSPAHQASESIADAMFFCGRSWMAEAWAKTKARVWTYRYNTPNPTSPYYEIPGDVQHAAENWVMFKGVNTGNNGTFEFMSLNSTLTAFSHELFDYWLSFVRSKDPNVHRTNGAPVWAPHTMDRARIVLEDGVEVNGTYVSGCFMETETVREKERCDFIWRMMEKGMN